MTARIIIDTREQTPLDFGDVETVRAKLDEGDYSLEGLEQYVAIERKSKEDMWGCVGGSRDRFESCLARLSLLDRSAVVIECTLADFKVRPRHVKRITVATAVHSCISWQVQYNVPFVWIDSRRDAAAWIYRFLCAYVKHRLPLMSAGAVPGAVASRTNPSPVSTPVL